MKGRTLAALAALALPACSALVGLGDPPRAIDAPDASPGPDASLAPDAARDASDAAVDAAPPLIEGTSCADVHARFPDAGTGVYRIHADRSDAGFASVFDTYCDMSLAGGGWTAFFSGQNGKVHAIGQFEQHWDSCPDPAAKCLLHLPASIGTSTEFLATCGDAAVRFHVDEGTIQYFQSGTQSRWRATLDASAAAGDANVASASKVWTGDPGNPTNTGWILSSDDNEPYSTPNTFASSIDDSQTWDFCNGIFDSKSPVRLMYR